MYRLLRKQQLRETMVVEFPSLLVSILIAELFYKFGSFTLELLAFLPTWFAASYFISLICRQTGILQEHQR